MSEPTATTTGLPPPLDFAALEDEGLPNPPWIAEPYIAGADLIVLIGDGGAGKTWLALDLAIALASGQPSLNQIPSVTRQRVLYLDRDASPVQTAYRLVHLSAGRDLRLSSLRDHLWVYSGTGFRFDTVAGLSMIEVALNLHRPTIVIFDAFRAFHAFEEADNAAMANIMRQTLQPLCQHHGITVILLHHTNKESEETSNRRQGPRNPAQAIRGGTEIRDACDCLLYIEKRGRYPTLYMDKARWLSEEDKPDPTVFRIAAKQPAGIQLLTSPWWQQAKCRAAQAQVVAALADGMWHPTEEILHRLPGIVEGSFGPAVAMRMLRTLPSVEQRTNEHTILWRRSADAIQANEERSSAASVGPQASPTVVGERGSAAEPDNGTTVRDNGMGRGEERMPASHVASIGLGVGENQRDQGSALSSGEVRERETGG